MKRYNMYAAPLMDLSANFQNVDVFEVYLYIHGHVVICLIFVNNKDKSELLIAWGLAHNTLR